MKVTIDFDNEIDPVIQEHLSRGTTVQAYIKCAVRILNKLLEIEDEGKSVGYGDKTNFHRYNNTVEIRKNLEGKALWP